MVKIISVAPLDNLIFVQKRERASVCAVSDVEVKRVMS